MTPSCTPIPPLVRNVAPLELRTWGQERSQILERKKPRAVWWLQECASQMSDLRECNWPVAPATVLWSPALPLSHAGSWQLPASGRTQRGTLSRVIPGRLGSPRPGNLGSRTPRQLCQTQDCLRHFHPTLCLPSVLHSGSHQLHMP